MLRCIANKVAGRRKLTDESLSLSEVIDSLRKSNGTIRGNLTYCSGHSKFSLKGVATRDMVDFVRDKFYENGDYYSAFTHHVYGGKKDERHYLHLVHGELEGTFGEITTKGRPYRWASIDFVVEK